MSIRKHPRQNVFDSLEKNSFKRFLKFFRIRPIFNKRYIFIGIIPFEYNEAGFYIMVLPTLGFIVRWDVTTEGLKEDLAKLDWTK
jgi:hypothetical protein